VIYYQISFKYISTINREDITKTLLTKRLKARERYENKWQKATELTAVSKVALNLYKHKFIFYQS